PPVPAVAALRQPSGARRVDATVAGDHPVDVGVDVDRGLPRRALVQRPDDAADVDVDEHDVDVLGDGTGIRRAAPRRVPAVAALDRFEGLHALQAFVHGPVEVSL